jgi:hypothetical protein
LSQRRRAGRFLFDPVLGEVVQARQQRVERLGLRAHRVAADQVLAQRDGLVEALRLDQLLDADLDLLPLLDLSVVLERLELPADGLGAGVRGEAL